jgi:transposase-like protein
VRVLRAQPHRDPALSELRGRLVRNRITDAYLGRELRGGSSLDPAEVARQVGTTTQTARQWLHTLRAARSGDPRLAGLRITQLWQAVERDGGQRLDARRSPGCSGP